MSFRRHVSPAQVPALKNPAFDLITRAALIAQVPAEPKQSTTRRDGGRIGHFVRPLRSAARPKITVAPALRPGHKVGKIRALRHAVRQSRAMHPTSRRTAVSCSRTRTTTASNSTATPTPDDAIDGAHHDRDQEARTYRPQGRRRRTFLELLCRGAEHEGHVGRPGNGGVRARPGAGAAGYFPAPCADGGTPGRGRSGSDCWRTSGRSKTPTMRCAAWGWSLARPRTM